MSLSPGPSRHPHPQLARLQRRAARIGTVDVHWERALDPTRQRLQVSEDDARRYILETVRRLHVTDFVGTVEQRDARFDVYGCDRGTLGWYVNIGESEDGLLVISHHEPAFPLMTVAGREVAGIKR